MIDFDNFESWGASFHNIIVPLIGPENISKLNSSQFDFDEGAGKFVSDLIDVKVISTEILNWLNQNEFCVFHGTRLLPEELKSLKATGLQPLVAYNRKERLVKLLKVHPNWDQFKENLDEVLDTVGPGEAQGKRECEVHFSLSKSGSVNGFNHYLKYGSEFDQHVAYRLFGNDSGYEFLKKSTIAYLVYVRMNGVDLVQGCHPFFSYKDIMDQGEIPGLGITFLNAWALKCARPEYDLVKLKTDCCMRVTQPILPDRIIDIEELIDL